MANVNQLLLGVLILQIYVNAAPSDVSKPEDIVEIEQEGPKLDSEPNDGENDTTTQTRQKRWFNHYGFGFPPINPLIYPSYNRRDDSANTANYGYDDPLTQIHRRLQEIASVVRQPPLPPPPHIPIFYPVVYVPTFGCGCDENTINKPQTTTEPSSETTPAVTGRLPDLEDERQNWGFVVNETEADDNVDYTRPLSFNPVTEPVSEDDVDYSRPISFNPVRPVRPVKRPPPKVEHGSVQRGEESAAQSTTTTVNPLLNAPGAFTNEVDSSPPNPCDGAILSCCHQPQVVFDCFAIQGCPGITVNGSPCDTNVILRVIEKFRKYYGQRAT